MPGAWHRVCIERGTQEANLTEARRVLLIEDDQSVRWILGETLREMLDVEILEAANGVEGLALALAERPDVVLMDLVMPGMDGLTVCRELRADPTTSSVPIVVMTGTHAAFGPAQELAGLGDAWLAKPFGLDELVGAVATQLPAGEAEAAAA